MGVPSQRAAWVSVIAGSMVLLVGYWLATRPGAEAAQEGVVRWFNDPPAPFGWLLAVTNPLLRPFPLAVLTTALLCWLLWTSGREGNAGEVVRAAVVAFVVAEVLARVVKALADQPRPLAVYPDLDTHGYPRAPAGHAFPSAHTAVALGIVGALWPWMRTSQRVVGLVVVVLTAANRVYVAAHWPVDVLGGAAVGVIAAGVAWLVATSWPMRRVSRRSSGAGSDVSPGRTPRG